MCFFVYSLLFINLTWQKQLHSDGFGRIQFESDCKRLVDGWNDGHFHYKSNFLGVLQDCSLLINYINLHSFNFVNRLPNKAADNLAKLAFFVKERYWVEEIPPPPNCLVLYRMMLGS